MSEANTSTVRSMAELLVLDKNHRDEADGATDQHSDTEGGLDEVGYNKEARTYSTDMDDGFKRTASVRSRMSVMIRPKKSKQYALKIVVAAMFVVIVTGIVLVYHFYHKQKYLLELGVKIQINEYNKVLWMEDDEDEVLVKAKLGVDIPDATLPRDCSLDKTRSHHLCLTWKYYAELWIEYFMKSQDNATCYMIQWHPIKDNFRPRDCFYLDDAHWYGGGLLKDQKWPIDKMNVTQRAFVTGRGYKTSTFGPMVDPYWLSSQGISVIVNDDVPLHVSITDMKFDVLKTKGGEHEKMAMPTGRYMCLMADNTKHPYKKADEVWSSLLNYTVCWSKSIMKAHKNAIDHVTKSKRVDKPEISILGKPIWSMGLQNPQQLSQEAVLNYAKSLKDFQYQTGPIVIAQGWEAHPGDLDFDLEKFPDPGSMFDTLRSMGFEVSLTVHPYVSTFSRFFGEGIDKHYLLLDAGGKAPGLVQIFAGPEEATFSQGYGGVLNMNKDSSDWFTKNLQDLKNKYNVSSFVFAGGDIGTLPFEATFPDNLTFPNMFTHNYGEIARNFKSNVQVSTAFRGQGEPVFLTLPVLDGTWNDLQSLIPMILHLSIMGYPLVVPPPIGGSGNINMPSEELYLRWLEIGVFFPIMHFAFPPHKISNRSGELTEIAINLHNTLVKAIIENEVKSDNLISKPFIKPLWYIENTNEAFTITDEFIVGDHILVAPVLYPGVTEKIVYFPKGRWKMHDTDTIYTGPSWEELYAPPGQMAPHFILQD